MSPPAVDGFCAECGYDYDAPDRNGIAAAIRSSVGRYQTYLLGPDAEVLRAHPTPGTWSALEYGCHVRDVFATQRARIELALCEDRPSFASMRREELVSEERYNEQSPAEVAREIAVGAEALAAELDTLGDDGWGRTGLYNYPAKQVRTIEWIARHTLHEAVHHLFDIDRLVTRPSL